MKKTLIVFLCILLGLFVTLSVLDKDSLYLTEKSLWKINHRFSELTKDPRSIPPASFQRLANDYKKFIAEYPDSKLTPLAHIFLGRVYLANQDYEIAREKFESMLQLYPDNLTIQLQTIADIGRSYSLEGDEEGVLLTYKRILKEYPLTDLGVRVPILIANYYINKNELALAQSAYNDALIYYRGLADQYADSSTGFDALRLLATVHMAQKRWKSAVDVFEKILMEYAKPQYMDTKRAGMIIKSINTISMVQLRDYDRAVDIYSRFIEQNPDHPFNKTLKTLIQSINLLKEKNVAIKASGS